MNYGKRSTSKKQKSMHSKSAKAGKKASVIFIKAFLVWPAGSRRDRSVRRNRNRQGSHRQCAGY